MSRHGADDARAGASEERNERDERDDRDERDEHDEGRRRVFFALWPDAATSAAIVRATKRAVRLSGGAPMAKERMHVTVAFLGGLTADELELARGVMPIPVGPFELTLDTLGVWPQSRTLWLAGRGVPPALSELEQRLKAALEERGFGLEDRIYRPHVTLARRARAVEETVDTVVWPVRDVVLAESLPVPRGVHYEILERWPL